MSAEPLRPHFIERIADVDAAVWDALAADRSPFLRHGFLKALEDTGCVGGDSGWEPQHLLLRDRESRVHAVMPLYLKTHSWGEYVFDWSWADAYRRHRLDYYPKLVTAIPFTPSTGPRILCGLAPPTPELVQTVTDACQRRAEQLGASSWHVLFPEPSQKDAFAKAGLLSRQGTQFHWVNRDYTDFDGFLATLNARKRKSLRKERLAVQGQGIRFDVREGPALTAADWSQFTRFYRHTYAVRGQSGYLSEAFFQTLGSVLPEAIRLVFAQREGRDIGGALFLRSASHLYGRYWGSLEDHPFLHFETCYYQGIELAIREGLSVFDAGAQGEHKIQRGFAPVPTWSSHWIAHPAFHAAIGEFLTQEADHVQAYMAAAGEYLPFRADLELSALEGVDADQPSRRQTSS